MVLARADHCPSGNFDLAVSRSVNCCHLFTPLVNNFGIYSFGGLETVSFRMGGEFDLLDRPFAGRKDFKVKLVAGEAPAFAGD